MNLKQKLNQKVHPIFTAAVILAACAFITFSINVYKLDTSYWGNGVEKNGTPADIDENWCEECTGTQMTELSRLFESGGIKVIETQSYRDIGDSRVVWIGDYDLANTDTCDNRNSWSLDGFYILDSKQKTFVATSMESGTSKTKVIDIIDDNYIIFSSSISTPNFQVFDISKKEFLDDIILPSIPHVDGYFPITNLHFVSLDEIIYVGGVTYPENSTQISIPLYLLKDGEWELIDTVGAYDWATENLGSEEYDSYEYADEQRHYTESNSQYSSGALSEDRSYLSLSYATNLDELSPKVIIYDVRDNSVKFVQEIDGAFDPVWMVDGTLAYLQKDDPFSVYKLDVSTQQSVKLINVTDEYILDIRYEPKNNAMLYETFSYNRAVNSYLEILNVWQDLDSNESRIIGEDYYEKSDKFVTENMYYGFRTIDAQSGDGYELQHFSFFTIEGGHESIIFSGMNIDNTSVFVD